MMVSNERIPVMNLQTFCVHEYLWCSEMSTTGTFQPLLSQQLSLTIVLTKNGSLWEAYKDECYLMEKTARSK